LLGIKKPYVKFINGVAITIFPQVFPPTTDTELIAKHVKISRGQKVLDLTTGSGALSVIAGLKGATGIACDINPTATKNAQYNFRQHNVAFRTIKSDLFINVPRVKFDLIIANGPYIEGQVNHPLEHAFFGMKKFTNGIFSELAKYLKPNGKLLISFAGWADIKNFEKTIRRYKLTFKVIGRRKTTDKQRSYILYEVSPIN